MNTIKSISPHSTKYLAGLEWIDEPPSQIFCLGELPKQRLPTVAIVGSRKPTSYGREVTERLAGDLARKGIVIVSGLALGVDAIGHQAALDAGGRTIAVLANGLHRIYPETNRQLAAQIIKMGGSIISEYDSGIEPMQHRFLERNRIVSGLADAIVITEAAARSGTLNTAAHALAQGKEVFVVPGNITSPMSAGCNQLLVQGATPVLSADDIISVVSPEAIEQLTLLPAGSSPIENEIIKLLNEGVRDGDEIARRVSCPSSELSMALTTLEINGVIKPLGANNWRLA